MIDRLNHFVDWMSNYLAHRKGLLPLMGLVLIIINLIIQFIPMSGWLASTNLFLHLGLVFVVLGLMLAWAL